MAGSVRAVYNYTYVYEGTKISFKKDEEFQLLAKSNKDWWQVRRWSGDGCAQDIYVPAVYVKEVQSEQKKKRENLYQNITDVRKQVGELSANEDSVPNKLNMPPVLAKTKKPVKEPPTQKPTEVPNRSVSPVLSPTHKKPLQGRKSVDILSTSDKQSNGIDLSKSQPLSILQKLNRPPTYKKTEPAPPPTITLPPTTSPKPRSRSDARPDPDLGSPTGPGPDGVGGSKFKIPPPVLPKSQKPARDRPRSMVVMSPTDSPPELSPQVSVNAVASALESTFARQVSNHSAAGSGDSVKRAPSGPKKPAEFEPNRSMNAPNKALNLRKTPSPKTDAFNLSTVTNGQPDEVTPPLPPSPLSPFPSGWTEHKTSSGHVYYYHSASGQSSWTRPTESATSGETTKCQLEKLPPRGWTRQINPITSTPIYTNCRTGERWSVASDGGGNFYYYNMTTPSLTVGELPAVAEMPAGHETQATPTKVPTVPQENIYDTLNPVGNGTEQTPGDSKVFPPGGPASLVKPITSQLEVFASTLSGSVLKKHGYLQRKKVYDAQGKKAKGSWQRLYVMLQHSEISFYTDHKTKETPGSKPQAVFPLVHCTVSPCTKEKKKNTFQVSSPFGEQFLLQADTPPLMNDWYSTIQTTIDSANQEFKDHPERFRDVLPEAESESPRIKKGKIRSLGRTASNAEDLLADDENDPMFMEISPEDRSVRVRTRLKKLMAKRPQADQLKKKGILEDPVFGCELHILCDREGTNVPKFLVRFIDHIEKKGLDVVGIYRLSGNAASVTKLRYNVEQGETIDLVNDSEWADINIVTGCLKLYLRELPDPIIPFKMFRSFIDAARASSQPQRVQNIAARVKELPTPNYCTLKTLIKHFKRVVEQGHINKMQASNVAIVFGPTLMRAEMDSMEMAILMPVQNGIVEVMINDFESVFRK